MRLDYSRSMVGCAADKEEPGVWVPSPEQELESLVVLKCPRREVEGICRELPLLSIEKFEVRGMSRIRIRPGCGKVRRQNRFYIYQVQERL